MTIATTQPSTRSGSAEQVAEYTGEVVYLYAFDVAYEMVRRPVAEVLGHPAAEFVPPAAKRSPRQLLFHRPQMVRLPPTERIGPRGAVRVERSVKLLSVGAVSVMVRVPFRVGRLEDLVAFHDLTFSDGRSLYDEVRGLVDEVCREIAPYYVRPHEQLRDEEAYTVFCINAPPAREDGRRGAAEDWFAANRRAIAGLLTEESDAHRLSEQEATESTARYLSYYDRDLVVVDWDAALIVDDPQSFDETLFLMEMANVQLAELEAYDRILDGAVERSYRDLAARRFKGWQRTGVQHELRELRIDLARLSDELSNITKFFGDWHLARIYQALAARFHLGDWHRTIDEKLKTLDDLYALLRSEQNNRWMLILEASIVLLFVVDLVLLAMSAK